MARLIAKMDEYNEKNCENFGIRYFGVNAEYPDTVNYSFETEKCFSLLQQEIGETLEKTGMQCGTGKETGTSLSIMEIMEITDGETLWKSFEYTREIGYLDEKQQLVILHQTRKYVFPRTIEGFLASLGLIEKLILENPYAAEKEKICGAIGTTYKVYIEKIVDACIKDIERQFHAKEQYCRDYYEEQIRWLDGEEKGTLLQVEEESEEEEE